MTRGLGVAQALQNQDWKVGSILHDTGIKGVVEVRGNYKTKNGMVGYDIEVGTAPNAETEYSYFRYAYFISPEKIIKITLKPLTGIDNFHTTIEKSNIANRKKFDIENRNIYSDIINSFEIIW